jgi:hypothetical protein
MEQHDKQKPTRAAESGTGQKPGQQSQIPGKAGKNLKEPHDQTSDSDV